MNPTNKPSFSTNRIKQFLSDEHQAFGTELSDVALDKAFGRIASVLTDKDMEIIDILDRSDDPITNVMYYLKIRIPNFEQIIQEEYEEAKSQAFS